MRNPTKDLVDLMLKAADQDIEVFLRAVELFAEQTSAGKFVEADARRIKTAANFLEYRIRKAWLGKSA
jgi:hypothetical protein